MAVQRHLSVHFDTTFFKGITHEEIMSEIEKQIDLSNVDAIQLKEKDCVVTLKDSLGDHWEMKNLSFFSNLFMIKTYLQHSYITRSTFGDAGR